MCVLVSRLVWGGVGLGDGDFGFRFYFVNGWSKV